MQDKRTFIKTVNWILNNTIDNNGVIVCSQKKVIYPEVTGYYIPSLLRAASIIEDNDMDELDANALKNLAISYAKYLCSIQKDNGSWYDSDDVAPYIFDSAQILKGLIAIRHIRPEVEEHILKGVDWILTNMLESGRLVTPSENAWGSKRTCSELIHIYCLEPIKQAGIIYERKEYVECVDKIFSYYKSKEYKSITNFSLLSHFYAYVMEGLFDLDEIDLCRESMLRLEKYTNRDGVIPAYNNVEWVCSTGLFQLALVWYKLGELEKGNTLFNYACELQNETGGWYGSYQSKNSKGKLLIGKRKNNYFPEGEISWACKYYLDALFYQEQLIKEGM